jgi:pectinesterase
MIVATNGSGDFSNLQDAVDSIPVGFKGRTVIHIKPGIYHQKVKIEKPFVSIIGECADNTVLTFDDGAYTKFQNGEPYGTFNSYTIYISGDGFTAEGISFENTAGEGDLKGQAIAAYVTADRAAFYNCSFLGCQDTLFTGPLPPKPLMAYGFKGPDEHKPQKYSRQYYESCFIRGDIDFIFGSATAVFNKCEIFANNRDKEINGFLTAASTPEGEPYGYVFLDCALTSDAKANTYYLGRPWHDNSKAVFIRCQMSAHIRPEGFHDWDKAFACANTVYYAEYGCTGPGAQTDARASWVKSLTSDQVADYTIERILSGNDG